MDILEKYLPTKPDGINILIRNDKCAVGMFEE
jgi:hypothetical protein